MKYALRIDAAAERDLEIIHEYLLNHAGPHAAHRLLDQLLSKTGSLAEHPERGALVPEVMALAPHVFRQVHAPPWRLIYAVQETEVVVLVVVDGRRDLATILNERLIAPRGDGWSG